MGHVGSVGRGAYRLGPQASELADDIASWPHAESRVAAQWRPGKDRGSADAADVECAGEITIPKLDEMAYEQVELNGVPFADFVAGKQGSFVLRGYVRTWMRNISQELDAIGLHTLIAPELRRA